MDIGVLIPTFNRVNYLKQALGSVLSQSHQDFIALVIDNGSNDGTAEFMAEVKDQRVRYLRNNENIGMIGSVNKGVALFPEAVDWCTILSDDDALNEGCFERLSKTATDAGAKSIVHAHRIFINEEGNRIREARLSPCVESALEYIDLRSRGRRETYLTGVLFNRKAFQTIGGYPAFSSGIGSDDAFIFALALQDRLIFEPAATVSIRIHAGAESRSDTDGIAKLKSIKEFIAYCLRAAGQYSDFTPEEHRSLTRSLDRYTINLNSYWWRTAVHAALDQGSGDAIRELENLRSLVRDGRRAFSLRMRLNVFISDMMHVEPESCGVYRACGKAVDYALFLLRNRLP